MKRLAEYQYSKDEAIALATGDGLDHLSLKERALVQFRQDRLCMKFDAFQDGIADLLGRPVWSHEFAYPDALWREYLSGETIDFADVLAKIPSHLSVVVLTLTKEPNHD